MLLTAISFGVAYSLGTTSCTKQHVTIRWATASGDISTSTPIARGYGTNPATPRGRVWPHWLSIHGLTVVLALLWLQQTDPTCDRRPSCCSSSSRALITPSSALSPTPSNGFTDTVSATPEPTLAHRLPAGFHPRSRNISLAKSLATCIQR